MQSNSFGKLFSITTFGESHGGGIGVVIDGCPAGLAIDEDFISKEMSRRKPGQSAITTQRKEEDKVQILSGVFEGVSLGTPIALFIENSDAQSKDYDYLKHSFRPSHADFTWQQKFGIRDYRGGGRSSARETAARVAAGAIAKLLLKHFGITVSAYVSQIGEVKLNANYKQVDFSAIENNIVRCPDENTANLMIDTIQQARSEGDTLGGIVSCVIQNTPAGIGEPVFDKLQAELAKAMLSINAVKGFEYGSGFAAAGMKGSQHNDAFISTEKGIETKTNFSGGIQGGISNGMDIYFNVAFKPVATIMQKQNSVDENGNAIELSNTGRHDPCVVPRAVPIVEAMAALVIADRILCSKVNKL
ncbi:MAG: chorismate synthase [Chitinophagales bacterium]|nr:chorismate synthase [Chitinophagales bacterium]MCO5280856.1 chorismate synthase [Chitinophagales bacterium]OJV27034.1 MAG: chorismate synthase [Bacteroidetes bacterium 37-13]HRP39587.1 chorismate synthase [Chitinophagales bacterium]